MPRNKKRRILPKNLKSTESDDLSNSVDYNHGVVYILFVEVLLIIERVFFLAAKTAIPFVGDI